MKKYSIKFKIAALILALAFVFQFMSQINEHTFTTGVINFHVDYSCLNRVPAHIDYYCTYYNCYWNN